MATALELVNRVLRDLRWPETADFTDDLSKVVLDAVNDAVGVIFDTWDWECDVRHDGVMRTMSSRDVTGFSVTSNSTTVEKADAAVVAAAIVDELPTGPVVHLVVTGDDNYGDTALRVASVNTSTPLFTTYTSITLQERFPGTTDASAALTILANEYVLPSTVRKVISLRHQENPIRLEEVNRSQVFDRFVTRPHETVNDIPEFAMVGARASSTDTNIDLSSDGAVPTLTGSTGLSVVLYPTPSSLLTLNYSYLIQRAELTATTDTLSNAGRALESLVVKLAFARMQQSAAGDFNPESGLALEQRVVNEAQRLHANQNRDPGRHRVLGSNFCETRGAVDFGRLPRNFGSLPNG